MADLRSITYQGFHHGISQDDYTTRSNQVLFSKGLDLNSDTYGVTVEPTVTELVTTNNNKMLSWFYVEDAGGNRSAAAAGESGEVYLETSTDDVAEFTFADGLDVVNTINVGGFVYFIRPNGFSNPVRIGKMDENNTGISGVTETISTTGDTIPDGTVKSTYPVYNFNDEFLLLGIGGTLVTLDANDVVTTYAIFAEAIVGIERTGSQFKIYSSNGTVAFWSFQGAAINESFQMNDFIRGAINRGGVDFMVSGFNATQTNIRLSSGYQAPVIAYRDTSERLTSSLNSKFEVQLDRPTQLARIGDTVYFVAVSGTLANQVLGSYGNKNQALGDAFQYVLPITAYDGITSLFGQQGPGLDTLYMGIIESGVEKMVKYEVGGSTKQSFGIMILNTLDGGNRTVRKKLVRMYVLVSNCAATRQITINGNYDQGGFENIAAITQEGNSQRIEISTPTKEWNDLVLSVQLNASGTQTPVFHGMRVVYELIED